MLKKTPLYQEHIKLSAKMVEFAGWQMPVFYSSIIEEHLWTRNNVSLFDICHMGELLVKGSSAGEFLDKILTNNISMLEIGQCRYSLMLNEKGGILDDLIVYRLGENEYMIVVNAATTQSDLQWMQEHNNEGLQIEDISALIAKMDLQGPRSKGILEKMLGREITLGYFRFIQTYWKDIPLIVSRTGYTGELGYELYISVEHAVGLWRQMLSFDHVKPAGLGARDTLRLEVGYPLYGQDISVNRTPIEANLERFIYWQKDFIGKDAILRQKQEGVSQRLIGIKADTKRPFRRGDKILSCDGRLIGEVCSGSFSPSLDKAIGLGYVDVEFEEGDSVIVEGKRSQSAQLFSYPFYKYGTVRAL